MKIRMPKWINERRQAAREKAIERYGPTDPDTPIKIDFNELDYAEMFREWCKETLWDFTHNPKYLTRDQRRDTM